ncbi:MAG: DUF4230 domain-containing protein [Ginsengibacter sp.]
MKFKTANVYSIVTVSLLMTAIGCAPAYSQPAATNVTGLLIIGLVLGAILMFLISRLLRPRKQSIAKENSHTIIESMRKVFKIVFVEGHFNELYTFEDTKKLFGFIPSTRRALVIIKAKVLVGYNFEKFVWETDEVNQKIRLISFPEPEILSVEPEYKYYNFDENIFNLLSRDDLTRIQANGKKQVELAAINSNLPKIAAEQMRTLLLEVIESKKWHLENIQTITAGIKNSIPPAGN